MTSHAWNGKGHVSITELAHQTLNANTKSKLDKIIGSLNKLDNKLVKNLNKIFKGPLNRLALLSVMPDRWKHLTVRHFFEMFDVALPKALCEYAETQVAKWHYVNQPYPQYDCQTPTPNIENFVPLIEQALMATEDDRTKMVLLILLSHFVGDIHQPLHAISHVDQECKGDAGGNKFCIRRKEDGDCALNLHYVWDSAMFFFSHKALVKKIDATLYQEYPPDYFTQEQIENSDIKIWAKENYEYAPFIYSIKQDEGLPEDYENKARMIAKERSALAAYRLANLMTGMISKLDS